MKNVEKQCSQIILVVLVCLGLIIAGTSRPVQAESTCENNSISEGKYQHYVSDCTTKKLVYTLEFASEEGRLKSEAVKAYEYYGDQIYTEGKLPQDYKERYVFYMESGKANTKRQYYGVVDHAEGYNSSGKVITYFDYLVNPMYRYNHTKVDRRVLSINPDTKVLLKEEDVHSWGRRIFTFFGKQTYTYEAGFDYGFKVDDSNIKDRIKIDSNNVILSHYLHIPDAVAISPTRSRQNLDILEYSKDAKYTGITTLPKPEKVYHAVASEWRIWAYELTRYGFRSDSFR